MRYRWDEEKRRRNLVKHGLDFADADWVLDSPLKWVVESLRNDESRRQAFAYVLKVLTVLTVVYADAELPRIISFRPAGREERNAYHDWLENDFDDDG